MNSASTAQWISISQLKDMAKQRKIKYYGTSTKEELVKALGLSPEL